MAATGLISLGPTCRAGNFGKLQGGENWVERKRGASVAWGPTAAQILRQQHRRI